MAPRHSRTPVTTTNVTRAAVGAWTHAPTMVQRHVVVVRPGSESAGAEELSRRITAAGVEATLLQSDESARVVVHGAGQSMDDVAALLGTDHSHTTWSLDILTDVTGLDAPRGSAVVVFRTTGAAVDSRVVARIVEAALAPSRPVRPGSPVSRHTRRTGSAGAGPRPTSVRGSHCVVGRFSSVRLEQIAAGLGQTTVGDVLSTAVSTAVSRSRPADSELASTVFVADVPAAPAGTDTPELHTFGPHVVADSDAVTATVSRVGASTLMAVSGTDTAPDLADVLRGVEDELRAMELSAAAQFSRLGSAAGHVREHVNVAS